MANNSSPITGRIYKSDGTTVNIVDLLGGGGVPPIDALAVFDITTFTPLNGTVIGEDGNLYDLVTLLEAAGLQDVTEVNGGGFVWVE